MGSASRGLVLFFLLVVSPLVLVSPLHLFPPVRAANPPLVEATILQLSSNNDLDDWGSGECRILTTVTTGSGSTHPAWPSSGSANPPCDDQCDWWSINCTHKTFNLYPNFIVFPEAAVTGGLAIHVEGQEGDAFNNWESYGAIDFSYSDSDLASLNGCITRSDATSGGKAVLTIITQICVTPVITPPPSCGPNGIPPVVVSTFSPMAPAGGTNVTITGTATASNPNCGIGSIRITVLGTALTIPETFTCGTGEFPVPSLTCSGNFGPLQDGKYVVYQVRATDFDSQISYEPPIVFDVGSPRTNSGWPAPTLLWGTFVYDLGGRETGVGGNDRKDIIFFAATDYGTARGDFISNAQNAIYNGVFAQPIFSSMGPYSTNSSGFGNALPLGGVQNSFSYWVEESNRYRFNFWYVWSDDSSKQIALTAGTYDNTPAVNNPDVKGCGLFDPCNWGFANVITILHATDLGHPGLRDAYFYGWGNCGCSTVQGSGLPSLFLHESMGHDLGGLGDVYCCDGGYSSDTPHGNVWGSLSDCQNEAAASTPFVWPSTECQRIVNPPVPGYPSNVDTNHYRANPPGDTDFMSCAPCAGIYGPPAENRFQYIFDHMPDPVSTSSFSAVAGVAPQYVQYAASQSSGGICVTDPLALNQVERACFPTGITTALELPKMIVTSIAYHPGGTYSILGAHVVYGAAPYLISDVANHPTLETTTHDGEVLDYYGLPINRVLPASGFDQGPAPEHVGPGINQTVVVPFFVNFRAKATNLTIAAANGTVLFSYNVGPAIQSFCQSNPSDASCSSYPPKNAVPIFPPSVSTQVVLFSAPILLFMVLVRLSRRKRIARHTQANRDDLM